VICELNILRLLAVWFTADNMKFCVNLSERLLLLLHYYCVRLTVFFQDSIGKPAPGR